MRSYGELERAYAPPGKRLPEYGGDNYPKLKCVNSGDHTRYYCILTAFNVVWKGRYDFTREEARAIVEELRRENGTGDGPAKRGTGRNHPSAG